MDKHDDTFGKSLFWVFDCTDVSSAFYDSFCSSNHVFGTIGGGGRDRWDFSVWRKLNPFLRAGCATLADDPENEYTLVQSQVVFRHGARTPIAMIPNLPQARYEKSVFAARLPHTDFEYGIYDMNGVELNGLENSPFNLAYEKKLLEGGMKKGQLTSVGSHQCYDLGLALRRRYIHKYRLLDPKYDESKVYFQSTYMQRTLDSLQGVVAGLYGVDHLRSTGSKPKFFVSSIDEEILFPNSTSCKCLGEISKYALQHLKDDPARTSLLQRIEKKFKATAKDASPAVVMMRQDLVCRLAHGLEFPADFTDVFDEMERQAPEEAVKWCVGLEEDRISGLQLGLGRFHHILLTNMDIATRSNSKRKLRIYSSHDTMIIPLLLALGCFKWVWPGYTSNIAYELWQHKKSREFFAKVLFNGEEQKLAGRDDVMMPYKEFKDILSPFTLAAPQYKRLCSLTRTSITPPSVKNPLLYKDSRLGSGQ